jgi:hypothetical protein
MGVLQTIESIVEHRLSSSMSFCATHCFGMFVDVRENLYCSHSQGDKHQVVRRSFLVESSFMKIVAGTDCLESTSDSLNSSRRIFVTIIFDVYLVNCGNNRILGSGSGGFRCVVACSFGFIWFIIESTCFSLDDEFRP